MYLSNQQRLTKYRSERRKEEIYDDEQQDRLYEQIAIERGLDVQSTALANLARSVIRKGADVLAAGAPSVREAGVVNKTGFQILSESIKAGKLDELVKRIIGLPTGILTKKQRIMQRDLINPDFKKMFNEVLSELIAVDSTPDVLAKATLTALGGEGNESEVEELIGKVKYDEDPNVKGVSGKARGRADTGKTKSSSGDSEAETVMTESTIYKGQTLHRPVFIKDSSDEIIRKYNITEKTIADLKKNKMVALNLDGGMNQNSFKAALWNIISNP